MVSFNPSFNMGWNFNPYNSSNKPVILRGQRVIKEEDPGAFIISKQDVIKTYEYDFEGNLVCYTRDAKTRAVIEKKIEKRANNDDKRASKEWWA